MTGGPVLSTARLENILRLFGAPDGASRRHLLRLARELRHKFSATLLSAWQADGLRLGVAEQELELHRGRAKVYTELLSGLQTSANVLPIKGRTISSLYPTALLRETTDLDCLAPTESDLWRASKHLLSKGWSPQGITLLKRAGKREFLVVFSKEGRDPLLLGDERVELTSVAAWGDFLGVGPIGGELLTPQDSARTALVLIVAEGVERSFGARDVLDASLLIEALSHSDGRCFCEIIVECALVPEWRRLADLVVAAGLAAPYEVCRPSRRSAAKGRSRRTTRMMRRWLPPRYGAVAYLQRRLMRGEQGRLTEAIERVVRPLAPACELLNAGLPLFGYRLDDQVISGSSAIVLGEGRVVTAATPIGRYVFAPSDKIREEDIEHSLTGK